MFEKKTFELPIVTREDRSKKLYAMVEPQCIFEPTELMVNEKKFKVDYRVMGVGEYVKFPLPEGSTGDEACAIGGRVLIDPNNAGQELILGATVVGEDVPSATQLEPNEHRAFMVRPTEIARVIGIEIETIARCGTCQGAGAVGAILHRIECPVCKGKGTNGEASSKIFITDIRCGLRSQLASPGRVPAMAYAKRRIQTDVVQPGQLVTLMIENSDTRPVVLKGKILFETVPYQKQDEPAEKPLEN